MYKTTEYIQREADDGMNGKENRAAPSLTARRLLPSGSAFMLMLIKKERRTSKRDASAAPSFSRPCAGGRCSVSAPEKPRRRREARSAGGAAVVGHVLQAAQQRRVVVGANPFGRRLVLQRHAALPGGSLSGPDHAVDLLEALRRGWGGSEVTGQPVGKKDRMFFSYYL